MVGAIIGLFVYWHCGVGHALNQSIDQLYWIGLIQQRRSEIKFLLKLKINRQLLLLSLIYSNMKRSMFTVRELWIGRSTRNQIIPDDV